MAVGAHLGPYEILSLVGSGGMGEVYRGRDTKLGREVAIIVILFLAGTTFKAVEPGLPSKTAVYVAAARAVGSKDPDPQLRNPDYLAIRLLGPRERAVLPDLQMDALDLDFDRAMKQLGVHLPLAVLTYRTKVFDAALLV